MNRKEANKREDKLYQWIKDNLSVEIVAFTRNGGTRFSCADGVIVKEGEVIGIVETKPRDLSEKQFIKYGSWLISNQKVEKCREVSERLRLPFYGLVWLVPDGVLYLWKITNDKGEYIVEFENKVTETWKNIDKTEKVKRVNSYFFIKDAKKINKQLK